MLARHTCFISGVHTRRFPRVGLLWRPYLVTPYLRQHLRHCTTSTENNDKKDAETSKTRRVNEHQTLLMSELRVLRNIRELREELQVLRVTLEFPFASEVKLHKHRGKKQTRVGIELDNQKVKAATLENEAIRDALRLKILKSLTFQPTEEHHVKAIVYDIVDEIRNPELRQEIFERMSGLIKHLGEMDKKEVDIVCNLIKSDSDHVNLLSNNKSDFNRVLQLAGLSLKRLRERPAITELVEKELGLKHRPKSLPGPKVELSQELISTAIQTLEEMGLDKNKAAEILKTLREAVNRYTPPATSSSTTAVPSTSPTTTSSPESSSPSSTSPTATLPTESQASASTPPISPASPTSPTTPSVSSPTLPSATSSSTPATPPPSTPSSSPSPTLPAPKSTPQQDIEPHSTSQTASERSTTSPDKTATEQTTTEQTATKQPTTDQTKPDQPTKTETKPEEIADGQTHMETPQSTQTNQTTQNNQTTNTKENSQTSQTTPTTETTPTSETDETAQKSQNTTTNQDTPTNQTIPMNQNTQEIQTTQPNQTVSTSQNRQASETESSQTAPSQTPPNQTTPTQTPPSQTTSNQTPPTSQSTLNPTSPSSQATQNQTASPTLQVISTGQTTLTSQTTPASQTTPKGESSTLTAVMPDLRRVNEEILDALPRFSTADYTPVPLIPWLADTDRLVSVAQEHFSDKARWTTGLKLWLQTGFRVTEKSLLKMAQIALQSFVGTVERGDMESLEKMVSKPLFDHVKNTLKVYKANRIAIHFDKLDIVDSKLMFLEPHYMFNSKFVKPVSLVPFEGPSLGETRSMLRHYIKWNTSIYIQSPYRDGVDNAAYLTLREMDNEEEVKKVVKSTTRIKRDDVQVLLTFGVLIRANEVYFVRDNKTGQVIDGSRTEKQFIHFLKFATPLLGSPMWRIYDMQDFNKTEGITSFLDMAKDEAILMEPQVKLY